MRMKCRECGTVHESKDVREKRTLTYVTGDDQGWGEGVGTLHMPSREVACALDNKDIEITGYDGCLGWP